MHSVGRIDLSFPCTLFVCFWSMVWSDIWFLLKNRKKTCFKNLLLNTLNAETSSFNSLASSSLTLKSYSDFSFDFSHFFTTADSVSCLILLSLYSSAFLSPSLCSPSLVQYLSMIRALSWWNCCKHLSHFMTEYPPFMLCEDILLLLPLSLPSPWQVNTARSHKIMTLTFVVLCLHYIWIIHLFTLRYLWPTWRINCTPCGSFSKLILHYLSPYILQSQALILRSRFTFIPLYLLLQKY